MSKFIPNSFQLPNAFVDEMLAQVSGNACKVYLLIVRKTRGWQKEKDCISYSQIQKIAGIKSHETIKNALNELLELGLIKVKQGNEKTPNQYRLNDNYGATKTVVPKSKGTTKIVEASTEIVEQGTTEIVDTENNLSKTTNKKEFFLIGGNEFSLQEIKDHFVFSGVVIDQSNGLNADALEKEFYSFSVYYSHLYMDKQQVIGKLISWFKRKKRDELKTFELTNSIVDAPVAENWDSRQGEQISDFVAPLPMKGFVRWKHYTAQT